MAANAKQGAELTDIPLSLERGDNTEISVSHTDKAKSNSLKRLLRSVKGNLTTSPSSTSDNPPTYSDLKNSGSLTMRFGRFNKSDGTGAEPEKPTNNTESGSGDESQHSTSLGSKENRSTLPKRLSAYWSNVFKKSEKKSVSMQEVPVPVAVPVAETSTDPIE